MRKTGATIHSVIESYKLFAMVGGQQETRPSRGWRKILFGAKTEKTAMVVGQHPPEGIQEAAACGVAWGDAPAGEDALEARGSATDGSPEAGNDSQAATTTASPMVPAGAKVQHPSGTRVTAAMGPMLTRPPRRSKCLTPRFSRAIRARSAKREPFTTASVRVWWCGWSAKQPVGAKVYYLQKTRCNLCGAVSTPDLPPGAGEEKCGRDRRQHDRLAEIWTTGMPLNRNETLQQGLGIPLPASTQWKISLRTRPSVPNRSSRNWSARAAQGDVLYNGRHDGQDSGDDGPCRALTEDHG